MKTLKDLKAELINKGYEQTVSVCAGADSYIEFVRYDEVNRTKQIARIVHNSIVYL